MIGKQNFLGKNHTIETKEKMSKAHIGKTLGETHGNWKGDDVGYKGLHIWVNRHKIKPDVCDICGEAGKLELSNKDHKYSRNLDDYQYVHKKCHGKYDREKGFRKNKKGDKNA